MRSSSGGVLRVTSNHRQSRPQSNETPDRAQRCRESSTLCDRAPRSVHRKHLVTTRSVSLFSPRAPLLGFASGTHDKKYGASEPRQRRDRSRGGAQGGPAQRDPRAQPAAQSAPLHSAVGVRRPARHCAAASPSSAGSRCCDIRRGRREQVRARQRVAAGLAQAVLRRRRGRHDRPDLNGGRWLAIGSGEAADPARSRRRPRDRRRRQVGDAHSSTERRCRRACTRD